jgi:hypothetical protein
VSENWKEDEIKAALDEAYRPAPWLLSNSMAGVRATRRGGRTGAWAIAIAAVLLAIITVAIFELTRHQLPNQLHNVAPPAPACERTAATQNLGAPAPPARDFPAMAYDAARCEVVLFGGGSRDDTWTWDGATWTERHPAHHPAATAQLVAAYDPNWKFIVLVESPTPGYNGGVTTWTWDGSDWKLRNTAHQPSISSAYPGPSLVFVPETTRLVLVSFGSPSWDWDGNDWNANATPSPPSGGDTMYDAKLGTMVVLATGGGGPGGPDAWKLVPETSPASGARSNGPRYRWEPYSKGTGPFPAYPIGKALYDNAVGKVIYFKDRGYSAAGYETWTWDDGRWELWPPGQQPQGFFRFAATYDSTLRSVVFFGGSDNYNGTITPRNETWVLTTTGWVRMG